MIAIWRFFLPLPCVNVNKCHSFCIRSCPRKFHESSPSAAFSGLLGASKCISSFCAGALSLTPLGELTTIDRRSYSLVGWGGDTPFPYISLSTPPAPRSQLIFRFLAPFSVPVLYAPDCETWTSSPLCLDDKTRPSVDSFWQHKCRNTHRLVNTIGSHCLRTQTLHNSSDRLVRYSRDFQTAAGNVLRVAVETDG